MNMPECDEILRVENLVMHFPIYRGIIRRQVGAADRRLQVEPDQGNLRGDCGAMAVQSDVVALKHFDFPTLRGRMH